MSNLKYWLVRHKPAAIVAFDAHEREHQIAVPDKKNKWALVCKSLEAVRAARIVAYDAAGAVMNGCELDLASGETTDDDAAASRDDPSAPPALPQKMREVDFASVLATGMQTAANIAVQAADAAMLRHEEAYSGRRDDMREAMNQFATVTKMVTDRLVHLEKAWHMLLTNRDARDGGDDGDRLAMEVIDRAFPKDKTNGRHEEKKPDKPEPLT
jgi:hypothetical protein